MMQADATYDRASELLELIEGKWTTQAIGVAAELGLADLIAGGMRNVEEMARATACEPGALRRLLRALASLDICCEGDDGTYELTSLGTLLQGDRQTSLRAWAVWSARHNWGTWTGLLDSVRSGESARALAGGVDGYDHLERDAAAASAFNRGIADLTRIVAARLCDACDFSRARMVVDVGGGHGQLLCTLLAAHPHLRGILFELPHAIDGARSLIERSGLGSRCGLITGSFFDSMPAGGDVYVLKSILHNWNDDHCVAILKQCRTAVAPDARVLLVERVLPERLTGQCSERPLARSDLNMLVGFSGRERTLAAFDALLSECGFALQASCPLALGFSLLEALNPSPNRGRITSCGNQRLP